MGGNFNGTSDYMSRVKKISLIVLAGFYFFAGINHFVNPDFYLLLIPPYLPYPEAINYISGGLESLLGVLLLMPRFRGIASRGIVILLILFIPSHVYFIVMNSCVEDGLCVPHWIGWVRLVVIHPILIWWAWWHR